MKYLFLLPVLMVSFIGMAQTNHPDKLLPKSIAKYKFGMAMESFVKKNKTATTTSDKGMMAFRTEYKQSAPEKEIKEVTWYFDNDDKKPLYEVIIEFANEESLTAYCTKTLGAPNHNEEWKWKTKDGNLFKAWKFGNKLVIAVAYPGTEWSKEWED